ncbi:ABC transporter ATP-binding protein [Streptococcus suis]|nr:ABC transporter ATP-binding protein [Streptococcus suis]
MVKNNNIAVKVEHVSKSFKLPTESSQSLRTTLVNLFKGIKGYVEYNVLQDISFEVEKGDFFGIVGRNGSGKSTLLKILSQIYVPERGTVAVDGKLVSFIELGVGFNPELTGKENVYLNGAMLGFTAEEIDAMYDDIVEFAELSEFMNQKLKNYSSGMQVRLAFSVAIKAQGDILILDEVLAVGDEVFQRKCNDYFLERKKSGKTTILVTHDMGAVKKYCNKALLIEKGYVKALGEPDDVANQYSFDNVLASISEVTENEEPLHQSDIVKDLQINLVSKNQIEPDESIEIEFRYTVLEDIETHVAFTFLDLERHFDVYNDNSMDLKTFGKGEKFFRVKCKLPSINQAKLKMAVSVRNSNKQPLLFAKTSDTPAIFISRKFSTDNIAEEDAATGFIQRNSQWELLD